ncbi:elicitor-responsive protein 1-like [Salvia splendens]|uniref:elicitor-responsive protein 1-like n=1 Tax=Salvia splendens TaxID=180675 RepID=UPI001C270A9C|nr:elicitor-responsive protein 1-like [Salvia splendens]
MFNKVKPSSSSHYPSHSHMSASGIQGQLLEVTVVGCNKLKDTEWISRQDPYVFLEYGSTKFRTRTCTDGGKNPTFQEKFVFTLIEGMRELSVLVWNSNTVTFDDFIGSGKVPLQKALSEGYDDTPWPIQDKRGRHAGEVRLIIHYANAKKPAKAHAPSAPSYASAPPYLAPPPVASYPPASYPPAPHYPSYPPNSAAYPPTQHHQPAVAAAAAAYPPTYPPPSVYPPPPTQQGPYYYLPAAYPPGTYPPAPYPPPY